MSFGQIGEPRPHTGPQGPEDELASRLLSAKDYAVLTRRTQELGGFFGFAGGAAFTFALHKFLKPRPSKNILFLSFFTSATLFSMASTHWLLTKKIKEVRDKTPAGAKKNGPGKEDPDFVSWKASQDAAKDYETGVGGQEAFEDRYATTRGDN